MLLIEVGNLYIFRVFERSKPKISWNLFTSLCFAEFDIKESAIVQIIETASGKFKSSSILEINLFSHSVISEYSEGVIPEDSDSEEEETIAEKRFKFHNDGYVDKMEKVAGEESDSISEDERITRIDKMAMEFDHNIA